MEPFAPTLSLVAPVYNESGNLEPLLAEVHAVLDSYPSDWELILVDDGSSDGTRQELSELAVRDPRLRAIYLNRNFGQTAALSAGIDTCRGEVVITLDADLQNDPADIPAVLKKMGEGYDVVSGWRKNRQDDFVSRTLPSRMANGLISWITGVQLHDYGCSLKAYYRDTLQSFRIYGEMHRFLPALCTWRGARVTEMVVNHRARTRGVSKYGISRTFRVILDLLTVKFLLEYSTKPMRVFGSWGLGLGGLGFSVALYLSFLKIAMNEQIGNRPLLLLSALLIIVGLQLIMLGLISELLVRVYYESQGKKVYEIAHPRRRQH